MIQDQTQHDTEDFQLLRRFVEHGSQESFGQLVERRLGFVYSVCRRELGDAALAEDVAQAVFLILAQKAGNVRDARMLAGWLFKTARFASRNAARRERHRQAAEREVATEMMYQAEQYQSGQETWLAVEPLLNDGIAALSGKDREAVVLRFFEGRSLKEVGAVLGTTEDTARKRVERAVEKLKVHLRRHGVVVSAAVLAGLLTERAVEAAPAGRAAGAVALAATMTAVGSGAIGTGAVGTALTGSQAAVISQGVLKAMFLNQVKVAMIVVGLSLAGAGGVVAVSHSSDDGPGAVVSATPPPATPPQKATTDVPAQNVSPEVMLKQVFEQYKKLSSFSMRIEHQDSSGLFPGKYTQSLKWHKGGRFELLVTAKDEQGKVPNYYANGEQVVTVWPDGTVDTNNIVPDSGIGPGWEVSGGEIISTLQNTEKARFFSQMLLNPPQDIEVNWKFGPRTEYHGQKVREIIVEVTTTGQKAKPFSYFISEDAKLLIGFESINSGKPARALYIDQKFDPALPATPGDSPTGAN